MGVPRDKHSPLTERPASVSVDDAVIALFSPNFFFLQRPKKDYHGIAMGCDRRSAGLGTWWTSHGYDVTKKSILSFAIEAPTL